MRRYQQQEDTRSVVYIELREHELASPEFLLTATHFLVVWRYDPDFTRQKAGGYGPDRSRPRNDGRSTLPRGSSQVKSWGYALT